MNKNYLLIAATALAMVGCANDDYVGDGLTAQSDNTVIGFNMNTPAVTRATLSASESASKLGNTFIVWGEKNETNGVKATAANTVFQNYVVRYSANTANTTVSNTNNWEYVGIDHSKYDTNVKSTVGTGVAQTIKYWDDNATSYTFTAVSALESDIESGNVVITKTLGTDTETTGKTVYDKGYTVQVKSGANTGNIYYADRVNIAKNTGYTHAPVQLTFRNFQSKVRFGIYETVPGYKVVITGIKYNSNGKSQEIEKTSTDKGFGVDGIFVVGGDKTVYTVTYVTEGTNQNRVKVEADGNSNSSNYLATDGENWLSTTADKPVGTASNAPTWDKGTATNGSDSYTAILPDPDNSANLKLQVAYKLISEDTGEEIEVGYKTVEVPAQYCQWKSNYAYTYLFKITDKSADLYPITFDAVVVEDETGNQETITTVSEPSITTYVKGKTNQNEYAADDEIYAFAQDGTVAAMTAENMKLYKVTTSDNVAITEASVAHALAQTGVTTKVTVTPITTGDDAPTYVEIPREDSGNRTITGMKWKAVTGTTYAVEYIKTTTGATPETTKYYKVVKIQ